MDGGLLEEGGEIELVGGLDNDFLVGVALELAVDGCSRIAKLDTHLSVSVWYSFLQNGVLHGQM